MRKGAKRPTTPTKKRQLIFLKQLAKNYFLISKTCRDTGIPARTVYNWLEKSSFFKKKFQEVEQELLDLIDDKLKTASLNDQPWAIKFFLSRRHPKYKEKIVIEEMKEIPMKINLKILPKQEEEL